MPVGVGYDPLQFVVPLDKFKLLDENPEVVRTPVVDLDNSLLLAIKDGRIIPLQATTMLGTFGKTVIGAATQETPFLDTQTGIVLSRTIRQYNQSGLDTGFMSDEASCNEDVQSGDFVLLQDSAVPSAGRLTPLAYGVITGAQTQADPHNAEACITDGTLSINRELEIHTF